VSPSSAARTTAGEISWAVAGAGTSAGVCVGGASRPTSAARRLLKVELIIRRPFLGASAVFGPASRVIADVAADVVERCLVADDVFVIIVLPDAFPEGCPARPFDGADVFVRGHDFEPLDDLRS